MSLSKSPLLIICGPTASGKSDLAMNIANELGGVIINIDAIQIYKEIPIITCSPSPLDKSSIDHHLYNFISVTENYSVSRYIEDVTEILGLVRKENKLPILVGGSGLYIKSLCYGLSVIPQIPEEIRQELNNKISAIGNEQFYNELKDLDPLAASNLHHSNTHRLIRAYEVFIHTGKSIYEFHSFTPKPPLEEYDIKTVILAPERKFLYSVCNNRFEKLINIGAVEEVEYLISHQLSDSAAKKAIGFREIASYINGEITKEEAITSAQAKTRQYAKRQITWFNGQVPNGVRINFDEESKEILERSMEQISKLW